MSIEDEFAALQRAVTGAQREQAQAEERHRQAVARRDAAAGILAEEYGVDTPEAARRMADELEAELRDDLARARARLRESGAQG